MNRSVTLVRCMAVVVGGFLAIAMLVPRCVAAEDAGKAAERKAKIEERKAKLEARKAEREAKAVKNVDARESNQAKRIQHGIDKGYLTADETKKLEAQQTAISDLETSFKADGKLSRDEAKTLQKELNEASRCIWAEKHDTDGNQMAAYRFGKNVVAKSDLTAKLADENLTSAEAKAIAKDFHRMMDLKKQLSAGTGDAAKLQAEYDELLNKYFEVK